MTMPPKELFDDIMLLDASFLFGSRSMAARSATESFDPSAAIGSRITEGTDWDFSAHGAKQITMLSSLMDLLTGLVINYHIATI
jgi:hypothetical protein